MIRKISRFSPLSSLFPTSFFVSSCDDNAEAIKSPLVPFEQSPSPSSNNVILLGMGAVGIDYIATLPRFPKADEKVRTESLFLSGGGNIGNSLATISRLSKLQSDSDRRICTRIFSKIANDSNGDFVRTDLMNEGIDTKHLIISSSPSAATGSVYVIVSKEDQTRTCVATPCTDELSHSDVSVAMAAGLFNNVGLLHLDSRHTQASVEVAKAAIERGICVSVDVEKDRPPHLRTLLPLCDIVFTNESFMKSYFPDFHPRNKSLTRVVKVIPTRKSPRDNGISCIEGEGGGGVMEKKKNEKYGEEEDDSILDRLELMSLLFEDNSRCAIAVSTLGAKGSILMKKRITPPVLITSPLSHNPSPVSTIWALSAPLSRSRIFLERNKFVESVPTPTEDDLLPMDALMNAIMNAEFPHIEHSSLVITEEGKETRVFDIIRCTAVPLTEHEIIDTTGAGDSYIGSFLRYLLVGISIDDCMKLATIVSSMKLRGRGAREGLPTNQQVYARLLSLSLKQQIPEKKASATP